MSTVPQERSFDTDYLQTFFSYLLKQHTCSVVLLKLTRNGAKKEKGQLQYVTTSYIFTYRKFVLQQMQA